LVAAAGVPETTPVAALMLRQFVPTTEQ
jgi:hypothetical protein